MNSSRNTVECALEQVLERVPVKRVVMLRTFPGPPPPHFQYLPYPRMTLCCEGVWRLRGFRDGAIREFELASGDLLLMHPLCLTGYLGEESAHRAFGVVLRPGFMRVIASGGSASPGAFYHFSDSLRRCTMRLFEGLLAMDDEDEAAALAPALADAAFTMLLTDLRDSHRQEGGRAAALLTRIAEYLVANFAEEIDRAEVARRFSVTENYVSRLFRQQAGTSFVDYLNRVRIDHAKAMLTATRMSVSEVAYACGFTSATYFIRVFKALEGDSPGALRRLR